MQSRGAVFDDDKSNCNAGSCLRSDRIRLYAGKEGLARRRRQFRCSRGRPRGTRRLFPAHANAELPRIKNAQRKRRSTCQRTDARVRHARTLALSHSRSGRDWRWPADRTVMYEDRPYELLQILADRHIAVKIALTSKPAHSGHSGQAASVSSLPAL